MKGRLINRSHEIAANQLSTTTKLTTGQSAPLQTNAVGVTVTWQISSRISAGVWGGYTKSYIPGRSGNVETTNYMVFLNFPNVFARGNLGGFYVGQPPKITCSDLSVEKKVRLAANQELCRFTKTLIQTQTCRDAKLDFVRLR